MIDYNYNSSIIRIQVREIMKSIDLKLSNSINLVIFLEINTFQMQSHNYSKSSMHLIDFKKFQITEIRFEIRTI